MSNHTLEERIEILERDLAQVKHQLTASTTGQAKDWRSTFASFANDPQFEEIVREGQAFRESENRAPMP